MRSHKHRMLAAAVLSAAMLCNTTVCAWASAADTSAPQASAAIKTALTAGLEVNEQKLELPRLLPSETKVKSVGRVLEKDVPQLRQIIEGTWRKEADLAALKKEMFLSLPPAT